MFSCPRILTLISLSLSLGCSGQSNATATGKTCEEYFVERQEIEESSVLFTIRNPTSEALWIQLSYPGEGSTNRTQAVEIRQDGIAEPLVTNSTECDFPCIGFKEDPCMDWCSDNGPMLSPIFLDAGGSYEVEWDGRHLLQTPLPADCAANSCTDLVTCGSWESAAPGTYEARITYGASTNCGDSCNCTPNSNGWCTPDTFDVALNNPQTLDTTFTLPSAEVEILLGD